MEIRPARETDIPGIRDVANRSLAASYDDVLDAESRQRAVEAWYGTEETPGSFVEEPPSGSFAKELSGDRTVVIVATEDDEVLGFSQAFLSGDSPLVGQIEWIHVRPDRRGEGIGDRLLEEIESALTEAGADSIEGRVIEANEAGREFYEDHGYEPVQTRRVRLAGDHVAELTLAADSEVTEGGVERLTAPDGESVIVAYDESERGADGPFHPTYLDEDRQEQHGWCCGVCSSLDVNVGSMDEFVCDNCGNRRRAMRWDAAYGG